ncbi:hypothetical protein [Bosea sp. (in: a-proteobacteria)]|uniref:hypothetical protein n=1 Tax=Bosea sp. (in: a-proteobacteria) TaxID=1871050 RepID=UPI002B49C01D|nr:hypothetical protein [Bosea sp. (in: a-proteobacteria)]WRH56697.1 MAG: hypothetical protein RSE11_16845 [Bosea sp. (in: a-proteobacteria)]
MSMQPQIAQARSSSIDVEAFMFEQLGFVAMHAGMAQTYIEAGDTPGLNYSLKSLTARVRAVVGLMNDLQARSMEAPAHG